MTSRLEGRLRKLEAANPSKLTLFVVWGRTEEEAVREAEALLAKGVIRATESWAALAWPHDEIPAARRSDYDDLS